MLYINGQPTNFWSTSEKKQEVYTKLVEMSRNDYYTIRNLLDCFYHPDYYKLISIDLWRQKITTIFQHINFIRKLGEYHGGAMFIIEKKKKLF